MDDNREEKRKRKQRNAVSEMSGQRKKSMECRRDVEKT